MHVLYDSCTIKCVLGCLRCDSGAHCLGMTIVGWELDMAVVCIAVSGISWLVDTTFYDESHQDTFARCICFVRNKQQEEIYWCRYMHIFLKNLYLESRACFPAHVQWANLFTHRNMCFGLISAIQGRLTSLRFCLVQSPIIWMSLLWTAMRGEGDWRIWGWFVEN
jgi:hypothetical protein